MDLNHKSVYTEAEIEFIDRFGKPKPYLIDPKGYIYTYRRVRKGHMTWECNMSTACTATLISFDGLYRTSTSHHQDCRPNSLKVEEIKLDNHLKTLCAAPFDLKTNKKIFEESTSKFPMAGNALQYKSIARSIGRWKKMTSLPLPTTMVELDLQLKDPIVYARYGRNTFGVSEIGDEDYTFYDGLTTVNYERNGKMITTYVMTMVNMTVLKIIKGTLLQLAGDGTHSMYPKAHVSYRKRFDKIKQLYTVHVIRQRKFYPLAFFLLQGTSTEVMTTVFRIVDEWLGDESTVESFMADYDDAARIALRLVWPNSKVLGCHVHYMRACGLFALTNKIYSGQGHEASRILMQKAYGLCFFPEKYIKPAIDQMAQDLPTDAIGKSFGKRLVKYLRETWLREKISVANEPVRCNNGCEIFHWNITRNSNSMKRNPFEFLETLQNINEQVARDICQWSHTTQSLKQRRVESTHMEMLCTLEAEVKAFGLRIAIDNFLNATAYLTQGATKCFRELQHKHPNGDFTKLNELDFSELFFQDRQMTGKTLVGQAIRKKQTQKKQICEITFTGIPNESNKTFFDTKTVEITNLMPSMLCQANIAFPSTSTNLFFAHKTISERHAEMMFIEKCVYIRELGSVNGSKINGQRIGKCGVPWTPRQLNDNDILDIGAVRMKVNLREKQNTKDSLIEKEQHANSDNKVHKTIIRIEMLNDDPIPIRAVQFENGKPIIFGRATVLFPATINNGLFVGSGFSYQHARLWLAEDKLFISTISKRYPTLVNGQAITAPTYIRSGDELTLGSNVNHEMSMTLVYEVSTKGISIENRPSICLVQTDKKSKSFSPKTIKYPNNNDIVIGRSVHCTNTNGLFDCKSISKHHASFLFKNGIVLLKDNDSSSGLFVTRKSKPLRIEKDNEYPVMSGDIIQFGSSDKEQNYIRATLHISYAENDTIYRCMECTKPFLTQMYADQHLLRDHRADPPVEATLQTIDIVGFKACLICKKTFKNAEYLAAHESIHHSRKRENPPTISFDAKKSKSSRKPDIHQCNVCGKLFRSKAFLDAHMKSKHVHTSTQTSKELPTLNTLKRVRIPPTNGSNKRPRTTSPPMPFDAKKIKSSTKSDVYDCNVCGKLFRSKAFLDAHMKSKHVHTSTQTSKELPTLNTLKRVRIPPTNGSNKRPRTTSPPMPFDAKKIKSSTKSDVYDCNVCGKLFRSKAFLDAHMKSNHAQTSTQISNQLPTLNTSKRVQTAPANGSSKPSPLISNYSCKKCHQICASKVDLDAHIYSAHPPSSTENTCRTCGKIFSTKFFLQRHEATFHK